MAGVQCIAATYDFYMLRCYKTSLAGWHLIIRHWRENRQFTRVAECEVIAAIGNVYCGGDDSLDPRVAIVQEIDPQVGQLGYYFHARRILWPLWASVEMDTGVPFSPRKSTYPCLYLTHRVMHRNKKIRIIAIPDEKY